jgi:hypothetical protein
VPTRVEVQDLSSLRQFRSAIPPREIASLCGPPFTEVDIFEVGDEMGLKGAYTRYGRLEARLIVMKLIVRASEPDVVQRLLGAYTTLAAEASTN